MTPHGPHATALWATMAAGALLFAFDPAVTWWFPSCPLYALTGWVCPLCGSLRAVHALLHGAPRVAFGLNPLTMVGMATALLAATFDGLHPTRATRQIDRFFALCFSWRTLALTIMFGVIRNVSIGGLFGR